jgi:hypothetical protein
MEALDFRSLQISSALDLHNLGTFTAKAQLGFLKEAVDDIRIALLAPIGELGLAFLIHDKQRWGFGRAKVLGKGNEGLPAVVMD